MIATVGNQMAGVLIIDDDPTDLRTAAEVARSLGITQVQARTSAAASRLYLEAAFEGKEALPDIVILDLDLGYDSGFELLRLWHSKRELAGETRMIVWTALGDEQQEICRLFKVDAVVAKSEGMAALRRAIEPFAVKGS